MNTLKKIFLLLKEPIILLLIGIFLKILAIGKSVSPIFPNVLISFAFIRFVLYASFLFHELGHLFFGKISGGKPKWIILGYGNAYFEFYFFKIKFTIKKHLLKGGLAYTIFEKNSRAKLIILNAGGFITNFLIAIIGLLIFGYKYDFPILNPNESIASIFIIVNFSIGIINLYPRNIKSEGKTRPNDGMTVLNLIRNKTKINKSQISDIEFDFAHQLIIKAEYKQASKLYEKFLTIDPKHLIAKQNLGVCYLNLGKYNDTIEILRKIEKQISEGEKFDHTHLLYVNFIWTFLSLDEYEKALSYSQKAYKIAPENMIVKVAYGASLIFSDKTEEGINILKKIIDFNTPNYTLIASIFLILGYSKKHNSEEFEKYYNYIQKNKSMLKNVTLFLYNKIETILNSQEIAEK